MQETLRRPWLPGSKRPFAPFRNHFREIPIFDPHFQAAWFAILRNFKKEALEKGHFHKLTFKFATNLRQFLRTLRQMHETKYQQFCANLARSLRQLCTKIVPLDERPLLCNTGTGVITISFPRLGVAKISTRQKGPVDSKVTKSDFRGLPQSNPKSKFLTRKKSLFSLKSYFSGYF